MPTYLCTIPAGSLAAAQKGAVAKAITRVHSEVTGAPAFFAEVIFTEIAPGDWFIGGAPLAGEQIFVHRKHIRGGRPPGNAARTNHRRSPSAIGEAAPLPPPRDLDLSFRAAATRNDGIWTRPA